ncbi:MAG TPA: hypothetical protein VK524_20040, partial [Polyangiaceae bacterium]|nr:hypothetical protein [Polyangiaceae bacterium]
LATAAYALFYVVQRARGLEPSYTAIAGRTLPARRLVVDGTYQRGLYVCSLVTAGFAFVLTAVLLLELLLQRFAPRPALIASACTVLATPFFAYGTSFYGHVVAGAFLVAALFALDRQSARPSRRAAVLAGACLALAAGCEYITAAPALVIALTCSYRTLPAQRLALLGNLCIGALAPVLLVSGYHWFCFGAPWRTGYTRLTNPMFVAGHARGLLGIQLPTFDGLVGQLVGERRGLFLIAPLCALALVYALISWRKRADFCAHAALLGFGTLLLVSSGYYMWWGGAAAGPRHLVPALPFLAFGLAAAFSHNRVRWLAALLGIVSLVNVLVLVVVGLEAPESGNVLVDYAYHYFSLGRVALNSGASNLGVRVGLAPGATLGPLLVWLLLGAYFLLKRAEPWLSDEAPGSETPSLEAQPERS